MLRFALNQHGICKTSRICRLCCSKNFDFKARLHLSSDKHRKASKKLSSKNVSSPVKVGRPKPSELFQPVIPNPLSEDGAQDVGEEIAGKLTKADRVKVLKMIMQEPAIEMLAAQHNLDGKLFQTAMLSFRQFCLKSAYLPVDIHIVFKDILQEVGHVTDLFPFFLNHAKTVYPHLNCMEDLKKISDLSDPSHWYPLARALQRKVIFHVGPTNSGKTYHALKRFMESGSGVYCGPLRLLAMEVFDKCNEADVPCDLITGETRKYANMDESPSDHVACTVEMMNVNQEYDVAVIDEIQMISDLQRGWSWTRALLGIAAKEVHVCGEETAVDLVQKLLETTGDHLEVQRYERLTSLTYLDHAVGSFDYVKPGDCIVCFSKKDIFKVHDVLSMKGHKCAVIYGDLPPGTKIMQSRKFNDPSDECSVLIATDAIGMGLNLAIKRVVFYSVTKRTLREDNTIALEYLSTSQALQIAGRAGRFRTQYEHGEVTTFWAKDLPILKRILNDERKPLEKCGMNPTAEMIEMFSYHLPKASLSNLLDIFVHVCKMDDLYFMCNLMQFKELAQLIEHIPLHLRTRYTLCSSPLKVRKGFAQVMFVKIARQVCLAMPLTYEWLCTTLGAPFSIPKSVAQLEQLEGAFDVVDIYLWLSYRYPDLFVDADEVRELRVKLDTIIQTFLNRHRFSSKRPDKIIASLDVAQDSKEEVDTDLIEKNPLQGYKPKPKVKNKEQNRVLAEFVNEMYGVENIIHRPDLSVEQVNKNEVKSFWHNEETTDSSTNTSYVEHEDLDYLEQESLQDTAVSLKDGITEQDSGRKDEDKVKLYSKLTGSYDVKTMFKAKKGKDSDISDAEKLQVLLEMSDLEKKKLLMDGTGSNIHAINKLKTQLNYVEIDRLLVQLGKMQEHVKRNENHKGDGTQNDNAKLGMNVEELQQVKNLLTRMHQKKNKKKASVDIRPPQNFAIDKIATIHSPRSAERRSKVENNGKSSPEKNFKFSDQLVQIQQSEREQFNTSDKTRLYPEPTDNNQTAVEQIEELPEQMSKKKLSKTLIEQNILSAHLLEELKAEWEEEMQVKYKESIADINKHDPNNASYESIGQNYGHVFYKDDNISSGTNMNGKTNSSFVNKQPVLTDSVKLSEKLIRELVISSDDFEKLKAEWAAERTEQGSFVEQISNTYDEMLHHQTIEHSEPDDSENIVDTAVVYSNDSEELIEDSVSVTETLLKQGILSESILEKLKSEWRKEIKLKVIESDTETDETNSE